TTICPPSLHDALPIYKILDRDAGEAPPRRQLADLLRLLVVAPAMRQAAEVQQPEVRRRDVVEIEPIRQQLPSVGTGRPLQQPLRSEEHTSELQSRENL